MKNAVDSIVEEFDFLQMQVDAPIPCEPITFWIPVEYKIKYDLLQAKSGKKFGKVCKEILKKTIDRVQLPTEKRS